MTTMSIDMQAWTAAKALDTKALAELKGANVNMVLMGASESARDTSLPLEQRKLAGDIMDKAMSEGACFIFSWQHKMTVNVEGMSYNKQISMLRGPGEVPRGIGGESKSGHIG